MKKLQMAGLYFHGEPCERSCTIWGGALNGA